MPTPSVSRDTAETRASGIHNARSSGPDTGSFPRHARAAALVAFVLRFGAVLIAESYLFPPPRPGAASGHWEFGYEMGRIAQSIALGHGFGSPFHGWTGPTAWQPPLYPYLLAGIFRVFGVYSAASGGIALALNCIAAGVSALLIYRIAGRIGGAKVALWSAWLWAVLPSMMEYAVFWAWETELTIVLFLFALWLTLTLPEEPGIGAWVKLGAVWGAIALINTTLISMMPFLLAWAWWQSHRERRTWHAAAAVVVVIVMIAPWIVRDRLVMGKWMFMRDNLWAEVSFGNDATSRRGWLTWRYPGSDPAEFRHYAEVGELNYIAGRKQLVFDTFHRDPGFFARTTMQHVVVFWFGPFPFFNDDLTPADLLNHHALDIVLSTLAWAGLFLLLLDRRARKYGLLLAPVLLVFPCVFYIATPDPRYRHIAEPIMLVLAIYAVISRLKVGKTAPGD